MNRFKCADCLGTLFSNGLGVLLLVIPGGSCESYQLEF